MSSIPSRHAKSPLAKGLGLGLGMGFLGLVLYFTPFGWGLEEDYGLAWLFHLRGTRPPPAEVIIVAIDEQSATELQLPAEPKGWPRHWHAKLIDRLSTAGARVIAFDLFFRSPKSPEEDQALAQAIRRAANVLLVGDLAGREFSNKASQGKAPFALEIHPPPLPLLAQAAMGVAPFPLPEFHERVRVNGYWVFKKTTLGETPTLPVLAFQGYALPLYDAFLDVLKEAEPNAAKKLPVSKQIQDLVHSLRDLLGENPELLQRAIAAVPLTPEPHTRTLYSLLHLYGGEDVVYLDFYGPPRHIRTISYHEALQPENASLFEGKIVCVGLSESLQIRKRDTFNTVFSQPNGLELNGVEILATAIANLVEDRPVRPLSPAANIGVIVLWGLLLGLLYRMAPTRIATGISLALMLAYLWFAYNAFKTESLWVPLIVPMAIQPPLTLFIAILGKYQWLRKIFGYFLPGPRPEDVLKGPRTVYGTCLGTDIERYTTVTEGMDPDQVGRMINAYHATVFPVVYREGGFISDVLGDAVLAIWHGASPNPNPTMRATACHAVLDIAEALERFNQTRLYPPLRTRFGVHTGEFLLGIVGSPPHLEYRATGDVVNTASRIEGLNKVLRTQILVSEETVEGLDERFLTRYMGQFLLVGKATPIKIYELLGRRGETTPDTEWLCKVFGEALQAYQRRDWEKAGQLLLELLTVFPEDGPARYYLDRLAHERTKPMDEPWDAVIRLETK